MSIKTDKSGKSTDLAQPEVFPIKVLCDFVKTYRGERDTLVAFLTNCQNALSLASESQKDLLLKFIISKLEGKAQIACSNRVYDSFEELKDFLKQNFGERKHYSHLLLDLQSCRQLVGETVAQFALKIESCVAALLSEIHSSDTLKKDLPGRVAMTEDLALHTFIIGLHSRLSTVVRSREIKTLNAAINIAMSEEKINNFLSKPEPKASRPPCKLCGKPGHSESECFSRSNNRALVPYQSRTAQDRPQQAGQPVVCRYCKNLGHDISQCIKRRVNNSRRGVHYTAPQVESPPQSPVPCPVTENEGHLDLN